MKQHFLSILTGIMLGSMLFSNSTSHAAGTVATPSWHTFYVDGVVTEMEAYNIGGNNYVKARDLGKAVNFNVFWQDGVQIVSDAPYTGIAPATKEPVAEPEVTVQTPATDSVDVAAQRESIVELTNRVRAEHGVADLETNSLLMQAAQVRAEEMAASSVYSHTRPDGSHCNTVTDCPYTAENIHRIAQRHLLTGSKTLADLAVESWNNSSAHLKNMTNAQLSEIGVGLAQGKNSSGEDAWYCVQLFLYEGQTVSRVDTLSTSS